MQRGMRPLGAGGLIWLLASACGETSGDSDPETSSGSDSAANDAGSMGSATTGNTSNSGTPSASNTSNGTVGTSTTAASGSGSGVGGGTGTGGTSCPSIEPAPGASCADAGVSCEFTNCVAPNFRNDHTLTCVNGAWVLANEVECLADCPATPPVIGDTCDATATPGPCPITSACGTSYAYCSSGEWSLQPSGRAPTPAPIPDGAGGGSDIIALICPNPAPVVGSDCCPSQYPSTCDYTSGQGVPGAGGSGSGFAPPGTTGSQGGAEAASTMGPSGATGSDDAAGGTGATGGTGAFAPLCMACDPTSMRWTVSDGCN